MYNKLGQAQKEALDRDINAYTEMLLTPNKTLT